jgi:hypothetical protein
VRSMRARPRFRHSDWLSQSPSRSPSPVPVNGAYPAARRTTRLAQEYQRIRGIGSGRRLRLEEAGLIARTPDPEDRRGILITLTAAGRELLDKATEAHLENEHGLLEALTDAERRRLADLLRKLQLGLPPR